MGTWGMRIYEDDVALDIRDEFIEQLHDGVSVTNIEKSILTEYIEESPPEDQTVYLALACAELETGTLSDATKQKALQEITNGPDPEVWGEGIGARKREFTLIKKYLETYDGKPVKRKSWLVLQKATSQDVSASVIPEAGADSTTPEKLDDASWQTLDDEYNDLPEEQYFAISAAHTDCFIYWLITRGYFEVMDSQEGKAIKAVKSGKMSVFEFMNKYMDLKFFSDNVVRDVREFVVTYYTFSAKDHPNYLDDYSAIMLRGGRKEFSFVPTQLEREEVAQEIDKRLAEYRLKPYAARTPKKPGELSAKAQARIQKSANVIVFALMFLGMYTVVSWIIRLFR